MWANHFTKPLQVAAFPKIRSDIQGISVDAPYTDLGWDRPEVTFIPSPQEFVDISDGKTDMMTNESREGNPVERRKLRESNPMVHTVEGSSVGRSKSQESSRRNILPSWLVGAHNLIYVYRLPT